MDLKIFLWSPCHRKWENTDELSEMRHLSRYLGKVSFFVNPDNGKEDENDDSYQRN